MYDDYDADVVEFSYIDEDDESGRMALSDLYTYCIRPTLLDISIHIGRLFIGCLLFRILIHHTGNLSFLWKHTLSCVIGIYMLYHYFGAWVIHILLMITGSHVLLQIIPKSKGFVSLILIFVYLVANELIIQHDSWQKIRGAEMLIGMKLVSVAFDFDANVKVNKKKLPNFIEYLSYMVFVGTCIFGPWISYSEFTDCLVKKAEYNVKMLLKVLWSFLWTVMFFMMSVCLIEWMIPSSSYSWWVTYRDALMFRCGHYFISFLSDTTMGLAGHSEHKSVSQPLHIELPRSLVEVVVHWNGSMHRWLKYYVFRTSRKFGGFTAVILTYVASSLLHGLNYRLAGVLMSLGFYTYIEYSLRMKLSEKLNACIGARACPNPCVIHRNTNRILLVSAFNLSCGFLAVFHLAYLGVLIDTSSGKPVTINEAFIKWEEVNFVSHWVALLEYIVYLIIK